MLTPDGTKQLAIPSKANVAGLIDGRVLLSIDQDWTPDGQLQTFKQGSLLDVKLADLLKDPAHLKPSIVFAPTSDEFLEGADHHQVSAAHHHAQACAGPRLHLHPHAHRLEPEGTPRPGQRQRQRDLHQRRQR